MKIEVKTAETVQTGNEVLGSKDKKLLYLVLGEGENKVVMNIGEKSYSAINKLIKGGK